MTMKNLTKLIVFAAAAATVLARGGENAEIPDLDWREISEIGTEGQAWKGEIFPYPYARIPLKFKDRVTKNVWANSLTPTGMSATFETDSDQIWISREFLQDNPTPFWFGYSGFDLYAADKSGNFRWLATTPIAHIKGDSKTYRLSGLRGGSPRTYRVYLPLRNILKSAKIGLKKGSSFKPAPPPAEKPVVFYGTSIVHGAWAAHPGLSHPSAIGRKLKTPIVNLGFSGSAQMETAMAETLASIDAAAYVVDATQNMGEELVRQRCEKFLRRLRELRPGTPIIVAEEATSATAWYWLDSDGPHVAQKCAVQREIVKKLQGEGDKNLYYIDGEWLFGKDGEASPDNCHPGDIGMKAMADRFAPIIEKILKKQAAIQHSR